MIVLKVWHLTSHLRHFDIIKVPDGTFLIGYDVKTRLYGTSLFALCCRFLTRYSRSRCFAVEALEYMLVFIFNFCVCPA